MLLGLWLNADRQQLRQAYIVLRGTQDASAEETPEAYFQAIYDDPMQAKAEHTMHVSRVASQREQQTQVPVDGQPQADG